MCMMYDHFKSICIHEYTRCIKHRNHNSLFFSSVPSIFSHLSRDWTLNAYMVGSDVSAFQMRKTGARGSNESTLPGEGAWLASSKPGSRAHAPTVTFIRTQPEALGTRGMAFAP